MRLLTTTALFSIGTSVVLLGLESRQPATATAGYESPLGLKVTSSKQELEIRWGHELQAVLTAGKGLIKITDGEMTESIPLDLGDLRDGYVSYTPLTNDVRVRFEVIQADGTSITESARVVATP